MRLINDDGGSVHVAADLVGAYLSAGFHPAEDAVTGSTVEEEKPAKRSRKKSAAKAAEENKADNAGE